MGPAPLSMAWLPLTPGASDDDAAGGRGDVIEGAGLVAAEGVSAVVSLIGAEVAVGPLK